MNFQRHPNSKKRWVSTLASRQRSLCFPFHRICGLKFSRVLVSSLWTRWELLTNPVNILTVWILMALRLPANLQAPHFTLCIILCNIILCNIISRVLWTASAAFWTSNYTQMCDRVWFLITDQPTIQFQNNVCFLNIFKTAFRLLH